jgi:hypothetical protein
MNEEENIMTKEKIKNWTIKAGIRALRTAAQAVLTLTGADMVNILTLDWIQIAGVAAGMAFISLLMSIVDLPEMKLEAA